jgi:hypothetical protein
MSRSRLAGIIVACTIVTVAAIVLLVLKPWERPPSAETYTLTTAVNPPGTGSVSPSGGQYESGVQVTITASPAGGYTFGYWSGSASGSSPTINITMDHDYSVTANFEVVSVEHHNLTISSTGGGSVVDPGEPGPYTYDEGEVVDLVAEADEGYCFVNWSGDVDTIADVNDANTTITMNDDYAITANFGPCMVAAGSYHVVGLKTHGAVVAVGDNSYGQRNVNSWTNIIQVAAGPEHTVGLKFDGTVVAVGNNTFGRCNVAGWTGIVQVAAGGYHTVGLKADGTVVGVGRDGQGQQDFGSWTDIVQVAAGEVYTVGLKSDGTVVITGSCGCDVSGWTNIIQIAAGPYHVVGLKSDGTVVAVGDNTFGRLNVEGWTGIVQVAAGGYHTVGLKADGTVVGVGRDGQGQQDFGSWTDIVQVAAGEVYTVGLKSDGTVVITGSCACDVSGWDLTP